MDHAFAAEPPAPSRRAQPASDGEDHSEWEELTDQESLFGQDDEDDDEDAGDPNYSPEESNTTHCA